MFCRNCGNEVNPNADICIKCGVKPFREKNFCPECGAQTKSNQEICIHCGISLKSHERYKQNSIFMMLILGVGYTFFLWFILLLSIGFLSGITNSNTNEIEGPLFLMSVLITGILTYLKKLPNQNN
jgi:predicted nucleic acid-binding Zn ribbon protein